MNTFATRTNNKTISLLSAVFLGFLLTLGMQGCSDSKSTPAPVVTFSNAAVIEGDTDTSDLVFSASLDKAASGVITIAYSTADATSEAATDYVAVTGSLQIPAGDTSATITVTINGDTDIETDETLTLNLTNPVGATLAATSITGTITSDDHADPSAYYTGTATVINPNDLTGNLISLADLRVMVSGNRIMMMNTVDDDGDKTILYDAQNVVVNGNDFAADLSIYVNMHLDNAPAPIQSTITGTITEDSRIEGVIGAANDTGAATGTFTADFSSLSNTPAASANIAEKWGGRLNGRDGMVMKFTVDGAGVVTSEFGDLIINGIFNSCESSGSISPINTESLYLVDIDLVNCGDGPSSGNYTGFAILLSLAEDTLVFAFSNASFSGIGLLSITP